MCVAVCTCLCAFCVTVSVCVFPVLLCETVSVFSALWRGGAARCKRSVAERHLGEFHPETV